MGIKADAVRESRDGGHGVKSRKPFNSGKIGFRPPRKRELYVK